MVDCSVEVAFFDGSKLVSNDNKHGRVGSARRGGAVFKEFCLALFASEGVGERRGAVSKASNRVLVAGVSFCCWVY